MVVRSPPIDAVPASAIGIALTAGFLLEAVAFEQWEGATPEALAAFFHRREVEPAGWKALLLLVMTVLGFFQYVVGFVSALGAGSASGAARVADFVGFPVFVANVAYFAVTVLPMERALGEQHGAVSWKADRFAEAAGELRGAHMVALGFSLVLLVQQWTIFASQQRALKEGGHKEGKKNKKKTK